LKFGSKIFNVKHQIPHITTEPPLEETKAKVPQLVKDSIES
uniref:Sec-independent protein translocase TatB n=1 Tax=Angiostrongylus cantonensis TaxID=6313 RepID=A0A0K0D3R8_ANGCA